MKSRKLEMIEGPEAFTRSQNAIMSVPAVPYYEIKKRIEEHRKQSALNPNQV